MAGTVAASEAPLNDVMLAMDVVDTLRHREALVERELSGEERRTRLIERLREVYRSQGITVPDRILEEGVDALEQDRFVYKPKSGGFAFTLARLYVTRARWGRALGIAVGVVVVAFLAWLFLIEQPAQRRAANLEIELTETIPARLAELSQTVVAEAVDPAVDAQAVQTAADGAEAAAAGNAEAARAAVTALEMLLSELRLTFDVRIVSRPGEDTGVTRIFDSRTENFYLIVEAIGPEGRTIPRAITSEEDDSVRTVTQWGVRVPEAVFNAVARDKEADGIVQDDLMGGKVRGELDIEWVKPTLGGFITAW